MQSESEEDGPPPEKKLKPGDNSKWALFQKLKLDEIDAFVEEKNAGKAGNVAPALVKKLLMSHAKGEVHFASLQLTLTADFHSEQTISELVTSMWIIRDSDPATKTAKQQSSP